MVVEIRVTGAEQLRALARDLKREGEFGRGLKNELTAGMRAAGKPLVEAVKKSAQDTLPRRGGLNVWTDTSRISVRNNLLGGLSRVGMRIVATKGNHDLEDMDKGTIRHPVFGHRKQKWAEQSVTPGFFTKPLEAGADEVQAALILAMDITRRRLEKGI